MIVAMSDMNIATRIDSYFTNVINFQYDFLNVIIDNTTLGKKCKKCTCLVSSKGRGSFYCGSTVTFCNQWKLR